MFSRRFRAGLSTCLIASLLAAPLAAAPPQPSPKKIMPLTKSPKQIIIPPSVKTIPGVTPPKFTRPPVATPLVTPKLTPKFTPPKFVLPANPPRFDPPAQEADPRRPMNGGWGGPLPWDWGQGDAEVPADPDGDPVPDGAPPADPGVQGGPTPWDWVAISLGAAALLRSNQGGGCSVGHPIVCRDPAVVQQPVIIERIETEAPSATPTGVERAQANVDDLPRLESGKPFELPGTGLGSSAGRVALKIGPVYIECRVDTWSDTGLKATAPPVVLAEAANAELLVAASDGKPLGRLNVILVPAR